MAKDKREYKYTKSTYVRMVQEACKNNNEAGKLIGCSGSSIGLAVNSGEATEVMENAALGVWLSHFAPEPEAKSFIIIQVDKVHVPTIGAMVKGLGGGIVEVSAKEAFKQGRLAV